jgi:hypothetical protein
MPKKNQSTLYLEWLVGRQLYLNAVDDGFERDFVIREIMEPIESTITGFIINGINDISLVADPKIDSPNLGGEYIMVPYICNASEGYYSITGNLWRYYQKARKTEGPIKPILRIDFSVPPSRGEKVTLK